MRKKVYNASTIFIKIYCYVVYLLSKGFQIHITKLDLCRVLANIFQRRSRWQCLLQHGDLVRFQTEACREFNIENNEQASLLEWVAVDWHSFIFDALHMWNAFRDLWPDDFTRFAAHFKCATIELCDCKGKATQCFDQGDFFLHQKVVALSLENAMWLLLDLENNVPRLHVRFFVCHAAERNLTTKCKAKKRPAKGNIILRSTHKNKKR
jgi:hypothetical protein